jgi:hypothetical protein
MFGLPQSYTQDITPDRAINQHVAILTNFANAIISGEKLIAPAAHGLPSLALANGMLLSSWQERAVELPLDSQVYQNELQKHLARSALREKANIEATIDMSKSYR